VGGESKTERRVIGLIKAPLMADVTLTITLPDIEAHALAIVAASLGPEQFEQAHQHWLNHWRALEAYSPQVEANMIDLMGEAANRFTRR
jgi:hypothetical protein